MISDSVNIRQHGAIVNPIYFLAFQNGNATVGHVLSQYEIETLPKMMIIQLVG
jgi:hypothetical protein